MMQATIEVIMQHNRYSHIMRNSFVWENVVTLDRLNRFLMRYAHLMHRKC